ncbi:hypothetical protein Ahos_1830 [Acidianus hospitalis W1]|uniref:Uncharacterized protein n=1 Tax=Acidianus hospitalis (strain W1) TaxID=933801 RepID=F4B785_ACIHW|nr:hypothetical protein [Acidianus hospitalis]AEE94705.1 hypothetical protein Ahos_1830 [Acidianus hospitalis W1]
MLVDELQKKGALPDDIKMIKIDEKYLIEYLSTLKAEEQCKEIIGEVIRSIKEGNYAKAYFLLMILQRALQDVMKNKVINGLTDITSIINKREINKLANKMCKKMDQEDILKYSKAIEDLKSRDLWNYVYDQVLKALPNENVYKKMLKEIRRISNMIVHELYLPHKIELEDIFLLSFVVNLLKGLS